MRLMSTPAGPDAVGTESTANPSYGNAFSIDENQSFFWQQTPQVWYDGAIAATDSVLAEVVPISCGRLVSRSVALRTPSFSMSAGR